MRKYMFGLFMGMAIEGILIAVMSNPKLREKMKEMREHCKQTCREAMNRMRDGDTEAVEAA